MTRKQVCKGLFVAFLALFLLFSAVVGGWAFLPAFAATTQHTSVLEDLQKDSEFNTSAYPDKATDFSIQVIQIAESTDGELFIYTYQPAQKTQYLVATKINMSQSESADGTKLYGLKFLSSSGVLCKYKVNDFTVSSETTRYYNITSIYRKWIRGIDDRVDGGNTVNEVSFKVGHLWSAKTVGDSVEYSAKDIEVITVTSEHLFMLRLSGGLKWKNIENKDVHFFAFNVDYKIDLILSADLEFDTTSYVKVKGKDPTYSNPVHNRKTLSLGEIFKYKGAQFDRISSVSNFLNNGSFKLDEEEAKVLKGYDWVFDFYETDFECDFGGDSIVMGAFIPFYGMYRMIKDAITTRGEMVSDVTLVRLEFSYDGEIYNLGVVSNAQTGSNNPVGGSNGGNTSGDTTGNLNFWEWLSGVFGTTTKKAKTIFWVVLGLVALCIVGILANAVPAVGKFLLAALRGLWWIICLPFRLLGKLFKAIGDAIQKRKSKPKKKTTSKKQKSSSSTKKKRLSEK